MVYNSDQFFIHRLHQGDETAFETIYNSDYKRIVDFCNQFINDTENARNQAQEAFLNLWLNRRKIETVNGIRSFLFTYARSGCLDYLRHAKVASRYENKFLQQKETALNIEALEKIDFDSLEFSELNVLLKKSIENLPDKCRQIFIMSRFEEKKNKEIADELSISVKTVEARMTYALKVLKSNLSEFLPVTLAELIVLYFS